LVYFYYYTRIKIKEAVMNPSETERHPKRIFCSQGNQFPGAEQRQKYNRYLKWE
jgi:hypothetical protein